MHRLDESLERRGEPRVACRLEGALLMGGRRHEAVLRDLTHRGLRVQTACELHCGDDVVISLNAPHGELFVLEASVRQRRPVARSLSAACTDAVVLEIQDPPSAWLRFVEAAGGSVS